MILLRIIRHTWRALAATFAVVAAFSFVATPLLASPQGGGSRGGGGGVSIGIGINILDAVRRAQEAEQNKPKPVAKPTSCPNNMVAARSGGCVCAKGFVPSNSGGCHKPPQEAAKPKTPEEPVVEIVIVQECLNKVGYDVGEPDGKAGRNTRQAWNDFQKQNGLKQSASYSDPRTVALLLSKCQEEVQVAQPQIALVTPAALPEPAAPAVPQAPATRSLGPATPAEAPARCLPQDLHDLLARTYGRRPDVGVCSNANVCLPKPIGYTQAKLDAVSLSRNVTWCENCVSLGTWLPLTAVLAIERAANLTLCASPLACYLPAPAAHRGKEVRTIFRTLPRSVGKDGDIAVIVGNENYAGGIPVNANAHADATAIRSLLVEQLGFREHNIIDLRDAGLAELERVFGRNGAAGSELAKRLGSNKQADIFVYASSFGMVREDANRAYLLPVDARTDKLDTSAYPMQRLYDNLGQLGARSIMVILEADFARDVGELIDPPNLPGLSVNAMPEVPIPGLAVFKASDRDQRTLQDQEFGIGLFTRYLIEGLAGRADSAPIGNNDSRIDAVELFVYTADLVRTAARKSYGVEQKPILSEIGNLLVGQIAH